MTAIAAAAFAIGRLHVRIARADDIEPDLMQTLVANDVSLNNNFIPVEPRWEKSSAGKQLSLAFGVEKILGRNLAIDAAGEWKSVSSRNSAGGAGFGNCDLLLKYVFLTLPSFRFALSPAISFPTSSRIGGENTETVASIWLEWGGRIDGLDVSGWKSFFRPLEIQGDLGYSHSFEQVGSNQLSFDPVLDYSFFYLNYLTNSGIAWPLRHICIFTEMNINQPINGADSERTSLFLTPGLAYMTSIYQISIGVQLPLNRGANQAQHFALLGAVFIAVDKIDPLFARTLF